MDQEEPIGHWHHRSPATLKNWEVDPVGLNGSKGIVIEGHRVSLQVTGSLERGKKRQDKQSPPETYQLTPHSLRMVHGSPMRFARLLMLRGALAGSYSRLGVEAAAEMRARARAPGFTGLSAQECGFESYTEMAAACMAGRWAKDENVDSWATFPAVDPETDAFLQETAEDAQVLSKLIKNVSIHLGYDGAFGIWSVRKLGASRMHEGISPEASSMWLGHSGSDARAVYQRGAIGHDVGALYSGRAQAEVHVQGFASWRTPEATVRFMRDVCSESPVLASQYTYMPARLEARQDVSDTYNLLRGAAGVPRVPVAADGSSKDLMLNKTFVGKVLKSARAVGPERLKLVEGALADVEKRRSVRHAIETKCVDRTIKLEGQRKREEGLKRLRTQPEARVALEESFDWPKMTVAEAVGFGLDRPVLPGARGALKTLPFALQECVLSSGTLGLLGDVEHATGKVKQLGRGSSRIERSRLFTMACTSCDADEVPVWLDCRGRGQHGQWRLLCRACQTFDEMDVRCVVLTAALVDEYVLALGAPVVSRATYACWLSYGGHAHSDGQPLRHARKVATAQPQGGGMEMGMEMDVELAAGALEAAAEEVLEAMDMDVELAAGALEIVQAVAAEMEAEASVATEAAVAVAAVEGEMEDEEDAHEAAAAANGKRRRPARCSVCGSLDHRKPQCWRASAVRLEPLPLQPPAEPWHRLLEADVGEIEIDDKFFEGLVAEEGGSCSQELELSFGLEESLSQELG